jgi:phage terminase large subunit
VEKWKGSVEEGVAYLRAFDVIVVHERCERTAEECRLYSHKIDRLTEDILRDIVDKHNHCIDAIRYALEPMIKKWVESMTKKVLKDITTSRKTSVAPSMEEKSW